jgi:hypothetical protein
MSFASGQLSFFIFGFSCIMQSVLWHSVFISLSFWSSDQGAWRRFLGLLNLLLCVVVLPLHCLAGCLCASHRCMRVGRNAHCLSRPDQAMLRSMSSNTMRIHETCSSILLHMYSMGSNNQVIFSGYNHNDMPRCTAHHS